MKIIIVSLIVWPQTHCWQKHFLDGWIFTFLITSTLIDMLMTVNLSILIISIHFHIYDFQAMSLSGTTSWAEVWPMSCFVTSESAVGLKEARWLSQLQITGNPFKLSGEKKKKHTLTFSLCTGTLCFISDQSRLCSPENNRRKKWTETKTKCSVACSYPETPSHVDLEFK